MSTDKFGDEMAAAGQTSGDRLSDDRSGQTSEHTFVDEATMTRPDHRLTSAGRLSNQSSGPSTAQPSTELRNVAERLFGDRLDLAVKYAELLITDGVVRGLIGPREAPRIWERHLLNCAAVADLVPPAARVVDIGSGAGLPGIVLAVARPELVVVLVEPLARRSAFLAEAVTTLDLTNVTVVRARAEECAQAARSDGFELGDVVTARALAPLDRLAAWCLPLAVSGGRVLAIKGASAAEEIAAHRPAIAKLGGSAPVIRECGVGLIDPPTTVVEMSRERVVQPMLKSGRSSRHR